ncbi:squalene--hopene cyclase [Methylobacterium indicum]|uniref:Squalene--hopene cyclase n=2 Tax=Methylobacterium indicum TaxID=1775910 RepID=A0ABR5H286_9HYPH|nr:squalene--hopene cyclase [Methylobacterium indicum]KMO17396.1 squalene--hopene cyclase [Methylobacterium indicum]KTS31228.1 squalene--hopene cyclase [Methylobacterium indicum]KTS38994.1 squalene--hopene cyclase [Methylobacterium indicum]KTS51214.1 squalene--hopene cyclase [Methylobacterium indicum]
MTMTTQPRFSAAEILRSIAGAGRALQRRQNRDGHWVFELEADATIPAEYVLLEHYMDRITPERQARIGTYLRRIQGEHGGWPMFHAGAFDLSASVKAYCALKAIGDDPQAPHMVRARRAILDHGGAERANVFTRIQLALFGALPWRGVPVMPVEIMHLPRWFVFNIWAMSYWARTCVVPLLVLQAVKPRARNPRGVTFAEIFRTPPEQVNDWIRGPYRSRWGVAFKAIDTILRWAEPAFSRIARGSAIAKAVAFVEERLNGDDGLGAIYPAMAYALMMMDALGCPADDPRHVTIWRSIDKLLVETDDEVYCQPCVSPVWDTSLSGHAMIEALRSGGVEGTRELDAACDWLAARQITDVRGDWAVTRPEAQAGGWAFQYRNDHYPDVDDTAVVAMLLHRNGRPEHAEAIEKARRWIVGLQSRNGGWGAFDADNDREFLNHIPFADHGALLDPPTADVTGRCVSFLAQLGHAEDRPVIDRALAYLRAEQERDGSWYGRWGTNYIYGTWSVLCALNAAGVPHDDPMMRRAVAWLVAIQRPDGGWGEDERSYDLRRYVENAESLPSQTAWAMLGLMAAGQADHPAVMRGAAYLQNTQGADGEWQERSYNAVGFPKVFYLKYHGYRLFFPLLALSRLHNLQRGNSREVSFGF